jgi:hypothetical protein
MDNDFAPPDLPEQTPSAPPRDPLIRYSVLVALGCAALCMVFTILYIFSYSLDSTLSFERHFDSYASGNTANLPTVLGLHMAQNRMFQQSCGMVAGIFFAFVGLALFFMGIQGTLDANGQVKDYSGSVKRLIPGGVILLASMIFVGISAMHPIDFVLGPTAPGAVVVAPADTPVSPAAPTQAAPAPNNPPTQSQAQPAPAAHLAPQSAPMPVTIQAPKPLTASQPTTQSPAPTPAIAPAQRLRRPALVPVKQAAATPPPAQHRFQP